MIYDTYNIQIYKFILFIMIA